MRPKLFVCEHREADDEADASEDGAEEPGKDYDFSLYLLQPQRLPRFRPRKNLLVVERICHNIVHFSS